MNTVCSQINIVFAGSWPDFQWPNVRYFTYHVEKCPLYVVLLCVATFRNVTQTLNENLTYITNLAHTLIFNSGVPDTKGQSNITLNGHYKHSVFQVVKFTCSKESEVSVLWFVWYH